METKILPSETAVIVLDIQNDFCSSEGAFKKVLQRDTLAIQDMVNRLSKFIEETRKQGCKIFFSKMVNSKDSPPNLRERLVSGIESKADSWPFGLERGSWGGELYEVEPTKDDIVLEKYYFDFFSSPDLKLKLEGFGIKNLVITGVYAEMCVLSTASRGFTEGYKIIVPKDLIETAPENRRFKEMINDLLAGYIAEVFESREVLAALRVYA
ncbi:MAG: isochorismatase family cysteine hydrolase [Patescibacteria group bacterium]|jgi:ureidoacrylate peracid hydrolase